MALGLFAIFGIIRYRTNTIDIKEMSYLFVVIGVSVINALANKKVSYAEIVLTNAIVIPSIAILEYVWMSSVQKPHSRKIVYDNMELLRPENEQKLMEELASTTGLNIVRVSIGAVNYMSQSASLTIYYQNTNED